MKRARIYLYGLGTAAVMLVLSLSPAVQASASSNENAIFEFESMVGVSGPFVGSGMPVRGLNGGGRPWVITSGEGEVDSAGNVQVEVRGLVLADTLINPVTSFRAVVSCLDGSGRPVNVPTEPFPASRQGNAEIETTVQLPRPCRAPIVFVTAPNLAWFARTTTQAED